MTQELKLFHDHERSREQMKLTENISFHVKRSVQSKLKDLLEIIIKSIKTKTKQSALVHAISLEAAQADTMG